MIIVVASGKGGTGKTTVAVNLALSIQKGVQFLDCDAEEPNAHLFLRPSIEKKEKVTIPIPEIDAAKCTYCGRCREVCAYNALAVFQPAAGGAGGNVLVFPGLCHGCGSCAHFCPAGAIREVPKEVGVVETGRAGDIRFVHGRLNIGEVMAPPVIRKIKEHIDPAATVIIDAPPGTSCPVVETLKRSDFCILVTEPTPFGLHDLKLAVEVARKLGVAFGVVINRSDLGSDMTDVYCRDEGIPVLMRIPFKREIASAYARGEPLVRAFPAYTKEFADLFGRIADGRSHA